MTAAAAITLCLALQAAYDRAAVLYVTEAAMRGSPEMAALVQRQIDMETVPSVSAHHLRAIEAQIERECRK